MSIKKSFSADLSAEAGEGWEEWGYALLLMWCVCEREAMCVCERERERDLVCVRERERKRER